VDLTRILLRMAVSRPRVLLAAMPDATAVRLAAERELCTRGWSTAATPAQANLLVVAGPLAPGLAGPLDAAWQAMPSPRARVLARRPDEIAAALETGRQYLADVQAQRTDAASRAPARHEERSPPAGDKPHPVGDADGGGTRGSPGEAAEGRDDGENERPHSQPGGQNESAVHGGHDGHADHGERHAHTDDAHHGGHREPSVDHAGHEGHGMHDMGGMQVAGLPMAGRGDDRDGLRLDQLHVALGPVLADWPSGLVLRVTLQGDVIQQAHAETLTAAGVAGGSWWGEPWRRAAAGERVTTGHAARWRAAARLDSLGRFLAVAGWADAATTARRLRDDLLAGTQAALLRAPVDRFARRVTRSWTLRWATRGLGELDAAAATAAGVTGPALRAAGDVTARYRRWLVEVVDDVGRLDDAAPLAPTDDDGSHGRRDGERPPSAALVEVLARLVVGVELAAARLIVASLDPDLDELAVPRQEVGGG
jgi:hypothetical protein